MTHKSYDPSLSLQLFLLVRIICTVVNNSQGNRQIENQSKKQPGHEWEVEDGKINGKQPRTACGEV